MRYVRLSFRDERYNATNNTDCISVALFTTEEVRRGIKDDKTTGLGKNFHSKLCRLMDDSEIKSLTKIFINIFNTGKVLQNWWKSAFVISAKKTKSKKCDEYGIISLMTSLKITRGCFCRQCLVPKVQKYQLCYTGMEKKRQP